MLNEIVDRSELLEYEEWAVVGAAPLLIVAYLKAGNKDQDPRSSRETELSSRQIIVGLPAVVGGA